MLFISAIMGKVRTSQILLEDFNVPVDVLDDEQSTPLMLVWGFSSSADASARFEVVRLLVEAGANKHLFNAEGLKAGDLAR